MIILETSRWWQLLDKVMKLADISSRGGKVPPVYLYLVFILPGLAYSIHVTGRIDFIPFALISIAIVPLVIATNLYDDYFDFVNGYDREDSPNTQYRRHPIFYYKVSRRYLIGWAVFFSLVYIFMSFLISIRYGLELNVVSLIGLVLGYGYTGPPFGYKYFGLGEVGVFISSIAASEFISVAAIGRFSLVSIPYFVPYALLISLLLFIGNYRDIESDRKSGIRTLASLLGKERSSMAPAVVFSMFYFTIAVLYFAGIYNTLSLIILLTSPFAYYFSSRWWGIEGSRFERYAGPFLFGIIISLIILLLL
jgi:1,4-dihydroxy-2-naphthoate octaprenyltransferase